MLADGPLAACAVRQEAEDNGISWRSVQRAKAKLGVRSVRKGYGSDGGWHWELPKEQREMATKATRPSPSATERPVSGDPRPVNSSGLPVPTDVATETPKRPRCWHCDSELRPEEVATHACSISQCVQAGLNQGQPSEADELNFMTVTW